MFTLSRIIRMKTLFMKLRHAFLLLLVTTIALITALQLWQKDLSVPFMYVGDTMYPLLLVKSIVSGGWIWEIPQLAAPFGLKIAAFPCNLTTDSLFIKLIASFVSETGMVLNLFWLLSFYLTVLTSYFAFKQLSFSPMPAAVCSLLFAFQPFAFYRSVGHLVLLFYLLPIPLVFTIQLASGFKIGKVNGGWLSVVYLFCALQGLSYIYTPFFMCFFLGIATACGYLTTKNIRTLKLGGTALFIILLFTLMNLAPSLFVWQQEGKPASIGYKQPTEAEFYGLKIRHLVSPVAPSSIPLLKKWLAKEQVANFPLENENGSSRLGLVGSCGFIMLLSVAFLALAGKPFHRLLTTLTCLCLAGLLLATVGGFGSVFNLLITPAIRCYNRISIFLAFFIFASIGYVLTYWESKFSQNCTQKIGFSVCCLLILAFGLYDQTQTAKILIARYAPDATSARYEREMVSRLDALYPDGARIFQLPVRPFPLDPGINRMLAYDHARPYVWSNNLAWSWPAFNRKAYSWEQSLPLNSADALIKRLLLSGFDGIWLDRFGYSHGNDKNVIKDLQQVLAKQPIISSGAESRYVFFDLTQKEAGLLSHFTEEDLRSHQEKAHHPIVVEWQTGFYEKEVNSTNGYYHRWSQKNSSAMLSNTSNLSRRIVLQMILQSGSKDGEPLLITGKDISERVIVTNQGVSYSLPIELESDETRHISFSYEGKRLDVPQDSRNLYFAVINYSLEESYDAQLLGGSE